tara:strand:+ start:3970 stop:4653 length:684 start_codon:yes stop_codon:yes gene_type:complete
MNLETTTARIESKFISGNKGLNSFLWLIKNNGFIRSYPNRRVNSLYYDNPQMSCIKDNLAGITPRKKYRLRWYGDPQNKENGLRFEKKIKLGLTGVKEILRFNNDMDPIQLDYTIKGLQKISNCYDESLLPTQFFPQLICSYERQYFENANSVRLTLDSKIRFWSVRNNINNYLKQPIGSNFNILEVKFEPNKKTELLSFFRQLPFPSTRCSKYLLGQAKLNRVGYI